MEIRQGPMESVDMKNSFWEGKKVFITGHTGFKGSWLCLWLNQLGANVTGYALQPPTNPCLFEEALVAEGITSVIGDIRNNSTLVHAMRRASPDIIFHMAAQPLVRRSYVDPVETYSTNVMGTVNLLEAVRHMSTVRAVVNVTTDKCYENKDWVWGYRENEPMGGLDPYSSSKGCSELVTVAYRNSYFNASKYGEHQVALATARAGNVIGGGDWAEDRLIPDILHAIESGQPVKIRNPHATRPWQHVLEPLSGYIALAENLYKYGPDFAEAFNFGPAEEDAKSVQWIVEELTNKWGDGASWEKDSGSHPHEANYLKLDCSKARAKLGWAPRWSLNQALKAIVSWHKLYRIHQTRQEMRDLCLKQISEYMTAIKN